MVKTLLKMRFFKEIIFAVLCALVLASAPVLAQVDPNAPLPQLQEPAFLVMTPDQLVQYSGGRVSIPCVAFGYPWPEIVWSSSSAGVSDYADLAKDNPSVNIYTNNVTDPVTGAPLLLSILELCDTNFNDSLLTIQCRAVNSLSASGQPALGDDTYEISLRPQVYEPAALIVAPTEDEFPYLGTRFTATCAAYGSPPPRVWFSSDPLEITDFSTLDSSAVNVYNEELSIDGVTVFAYSTLEVCTSVADFETFSRYLTTIECHADNGVTGVGNIGVQSISFRPRPVVRILSFSVTFNIKNLVIDVTFSAPYDPAIFGCFGDKIGLTDTNTDIIFSLRYPGSCTATSANSVQISVDNRDYLEFLLVGLSVGRGDSSRMYLYTTSTEFFNGAVALEAITTDAPLQALAYVNNDMINNIPALSSFDVSRLGSTSLYLHFDSIVIPSSLQVNQLILADGRGSANERQLSGATFANLNLAKSIRIQLTQVDQNYLEANDICTSLSNCYLYFSLPNDTFRGHSIGVPSGGLPSSSALAVSRVHNPVTVDEVYVSIDLGYIGAELALQLPTYGWYLIRPSIDETITRVWCQGQTSGDINPKLYYNGVKVGDKFSWPTSVSFSSPAGIYTTDMLGLYTCTTYLDSFNVSHILDTQSRVYILTGNEYTVEVLEPIVVRFTYSGDLVGSEFSLRDSSGNAPLFEYTIELSANVVQFTIAQTWLSISGDYGIVHTGSTEATFRIIVKQPTVDISPAVISLLPEDDGTIAVTCTPSYPALSDHIIYSRSDEPAVRYSDRPFEFSVLDKLALEGVVITCILLDPSVTNPDQFDSTIYLAQDSSTIRNVNDTLLVNEIVESSPNTVDNFTTIVVASRFSDPTTLECIGHIASGNSDIYWSILKDGEPPFIPSTDIDNEFYGISVGNNYLRLILNHANEAFSGAVRCISAGTQEQITVFVREDDSRVQYCPRDDVDSDWGLTWRLTQAGQWDGQRCPSINGKPTTGTITRRCMNSGRWGDVDASDCNTMVFSRVQDQASLYFVDDDYLDDANLIIRANELSASLNKEIQPGVDSLFPQDLQTSSNIIEGLVNSVRTRNPSTIHTYVANSYNYILHENNTAGWVQLQVMLDRSSVRILNSAEDFGVYLYESLVSGVVNTSSIGNSEQVSITNDNIEFRVEVLPAVPEGDEYYQIGDYTDGQGAARVVLPVELLRQQGTEGIVFAGFKNLNYFLPRDQINFNFNTTTVIRSFLVSTQLQSSSTPPANFPEDSLAQFEFQTLRASRVSEPRLVFWDRVEGIWSMEGALSSSEILENSEFKVFNVSGNSTHLTTFGVAVDVNQNIFSFTFPVWIGAGIVIVGALLSIVGLLLSCIIDDVPRFFTVTFTVHINFLISLICAFVAFLGGIELAIDHRLGCAATAGLLHYFFTASFTWLLCEAVLVSTFSFFATRWYWVFVFLFAGWGIPAIPTAITLGLLHPLYGTITQCWFYFDGDFNQEIVLGFIVPKIIILALVLILVVIGMFKNFAFAYKYTNKLQRSLRDPFSAMIWFLWLSVILLSLLLGCTWAFAMLMVNVHTLDAETLAWVFMGLSAGLGVYLFFFSVVVLIINQKLDYERFYAKRSAMTADPGGSDYRNLDFNRRVSVAAGGTSMLTPNPMFGEEGEKSVVY